MLRLLKSDVNGEGIKLNIVDFSLSNEGDVSEADIFFMGGGSDMGQSIVYSHFLKYKNSVAMQ